MSQLVNYEKKVGAAWLTINRPDVRNAISLAVSEEIARLVEQAESDPEIRAVVITGAGDRAFAAGADLNEVPETTNSPEAAKAFDDAFETGQRALAACPLPTIARIQGHCIGGGLELALACDLRIAIERAKFGYPVARFGLIPTPASLERLIESIGPNQAKWLLFTGEWISAQQAEAWGLINRAIPDETFEADVEQIVAQTAQGAPLTISVSKHLIETKTKQGQLGEAIIDWAYQKIYTSRDLQEGLRAFQEKRRPAFQNK